MAALTNDLAVTYAPINSLTAYTKNSRTHDESQIKQIAASIKEFGFTNPLLIDNKNNIIAGHGRLMAAKLLNLDSVPTITLDGLSDTQKRAYIIADNKLALNAGWDNELLMIELNSLNDDDFDMDLLGFDVASLAIAMGLGADFDAGTSEDQGKLDKIEPIVCPACSHEFYK